MTEIKQKKVLAIVEKWIKSRINDTDVCYRTGEDAKDYSSYADAGSPWISFEGPMHDLLNYGQDFDGWKFKNDFDKFLDKMGLWYEQGESWNLSLYED